MRITEYAIHLDNDRKPALVKEHAGNYPEVNRLDSPEKIYKTMNAIYNASYLAEEHAWAIALDTKLNPAGVFEISHGTANASFLTPREIFIRLLLCGATSFFVVHNHPSGDTAPSSADIKATKRLKEAGELMSVELLDHIIIGESYLSMREERFF